MYQRLQFGDKNVYNVKLQKLYSCEFRGVMLNQQVPVKWQPTFHPGKTTLIGQAKKCRVRVAFPSRFSRQCRLKLLPFKEIQLRSPVKDVGTSQKNKYKIYLIQPTAYTSINCYVNNIDITLLSTSSYLKLGDRNVRYFSVIEHNVVSNLQLFFPGNYFCVWCRA